MKKRGKKNRNERKESRAEVTEGYAEKRSNGGKWGITKDANGKINDADRIKEAQ